MTGPSVVSLLNRYVEGWPEHDDEGAYVGPLSDVLTIRFKTDVHFTAYTTKIPRRHTAGSLARADEAGVRMVAAVFDVDGEGHQATPEWWAAEREKLQPLLDDGAFVYRTRGGYRIVYELTEPFPIDTAADAERWTRLYLAWRNFLKAEHGIVIDKKCKDWQHLFRAPHATRDGVLLELETFGDPEALGFWSTAEDDIAGYEEPIVSEPEKTPKNSESLAPSVIGSRRLRDSAALLLGANWPPPGQRADARLALAGACARAGWPREEAVAFMQAVHSHVQDRGDVTDAYLEGMVASALARTERDAPTMGWPSLARFVGAAVVEPIEKWFKSSDPDGQAQFEALAARKTDAKTSPAAPSPPPAKKDSGIFWDDWDEPLPPVKWLVEGLIPQGTVGAFVAHGSSLKTWTMLSIAAAVAQGKAWLGKYPVAKGKVIIIDYESGRYELRRRVLMLEKGKVIGLGAWSYPEKRIDDVSFWIDLGNEDDVVLVCVDSLAEGTSPGVDENSKDASFPLQLAARFTEATGASVLFVHHSKKDDSGDARKVVRGSTAIYAALDWCFAFENVADTQGYKRMLMNSIKPCMGAKPPPVPLELTDKGLTTFETKEKPTKDSPPAQIQEAIKLALALKGTIETKALLAAEIGIRKEIVTPQLDAMVVRGEVVCLRDKGYSLEGPEHRRKRVIEAVNKNQYRKGVGAIASAADVDSETVQEMLDDGTIVKSGEGRYIVKQG